MMHVAPWQRHGLTHFSRDFETSLVGDESAAKLDLVTDVYAYSLRSFSTGRFLLGALPFNRNKADNGVRCHRAFLTLHPPNGETITIFETRHTVGVNFVPVCPPSGHFALLAVSDREPPMSDLTETPNRVRYDIREVFTKYGMKTAGLATGVCHFQSQLCYFIDIWEQEWKTTLDAIDRGVSATVSTF